MGTLGNQPWWNVPENFDMPLVFYIEAEQEDFIFGPADTYLRSIEVHSQTLVQLESWFTVAGHTRVTVVGPRRAREWLLDMIRSVWSKDFNRQNRGLQMLQRVRRQRLTEADFSMRQWPDNWDPSLASFMNGNVTVGVCLSRLFDCLGFP
uniref:putative KHDC1-like protein n=1 Tax=Jaculus jaculus TaxID=51337 RepID=UPI001E1B5745|nr:putative KHDC1-like protein [Jaculus jaculus]